MKMRPKKILKILLCLLMTVTMMPSRVCAQNIENVKISTFEGDGKHKVFFQWPTEVPFKGEFDGAFYVLTFETNIPVEKISVDKILPALPVSLRNWQTEQQKEKAILKISLPEKYTAEASSEGKKTVLSLYEGQRQIIKDKKTEKTIEKKPVQEKKSENTDIKFEEIQKEFVDEKETVLKNSEEQKEEILPLKTDFFSEEDKIIKALSTPLELQEGKKEKTEVEEDDFRASDEGGYRIASLSFPWPKMTALAAFRRGGYLWLVFDRKAQFDFDTEKNIYQDIIYEMVEIPHSQGTVFRLITAPGYNPSFRREGMLWIMDLMYQPLRPRSSVDLVLQRKTPFGPRLFIPLMETPKVIPILDPEIGDVTYVVPLFSLNKGMSHDRNFVDVSFSKTAQGIIVIPRSDNISTFTSNAGLEIRGPKDGMRFSSQDILSFLAQNKVTTDPMKQILDIGVWSMMSDEQNYYPKAQELMKNVLEASKDEKPLKQLILARYYFANGLYPETLGVLRNIEKDSPDFAQKGPVAALLGATNFMMRRFPEALKAFANPELRLNQDVDFWRAVAQAESSGYPENFLDKIKADMGVLQAYPPAVKTRLALTGLKAAVKGRDELAVQNFVEIAYNTQITPAQQKEADFLYALWQEYLGLFHQAHKTMTELADSTDFYFRAFGGLEKIRMDAHLHRTTPEERIKNLEQLLFAWSDGDFQYNLMKQLIATYEEQKDYAHVLYLLKDMQIRYRDKKEIKDVPEMMEEMFQKLYLNENSEKNLPPVKAIAIYDEFRDLLPKGKKGVLIARKLADRLTAIDLLDKAAGLLEDQLRQKITDEDKSMLGTRLGLIYLLNKMPEKTLSALDKTQIKNISEKTDHQRRYIRAKALKELGRTEEAIDLLKKDSSYESTLLQAEIYWDAKQWDNVADTFKLLIKRPQKGVPLTEKEARAVLDWATALRLAGRPKVLTRLRENFLPYMKETSLAESFDFITQAPAKGVMDYKTIPNEINMAERFASSFKEHLEQLKKETQLIKDKPVKNEDIRKVSQLPK